MKTLWSKWRFLAGAAALLSACTNTGNLINPELPPRDSSLAFQDGYIQGCPAGFWDGRRPGYSFALNWKDIKRYDTDVEYKKGWDQGHDACYVEQIRNPWMGGDGGGSTG